MKKPYTPPRALTVAIVNQSLIAYTGDSLPSDIGSPSIRNARSNWSDDTPDDNDNYADEDL